jgi:hypothetical protein
MFPKKGKTFPGGFRKGRHELHYAAAIAAALRKELGDTHQAVKTVLKWTVADERTIKNWLAGTNGPRGEHLIDLIHHSDEVMDAFLRLTGREPVIVANKLVGARNQLAQILEQIDLFMGEGSDRR